MKNPYADENGLPAVGKLNEFLDWETAQAKEREAQMTPEEQKQHQVAKRAIGKRMQSEVNVSLV